MAASTLPWVPGTSPSSWGRRGRWGGWRSISRALRPASQQLPPLVFISPMATLRLTRAKHCSHDPSADVAFPPSTVAHHPWKPNSYPPHFRAPSQTTSWKGAWWAWRVNLVKDPFYRCQHQPSKALLHPLCRTLQAPGTFKLLGRPLPTPEPQLHPDPFTSPSPPSLLYPSTPGCPSPFAHTVLSLSSPGPQMALWRTGGNREWGRKGHIWIPGLKSPPPSQPSLPQKLTLTSARDDFLALLTPVHAFAKIALEPL